jgi:hypothetical protein
MGASSIFVTYVDELIYHLDTITSFSRVRDTALKQINVGALPQAERDLALGAFKSPAFSVDRLLPMFFLSLHTGFEEFLRQLVIEFADEVNSRGLSYVEALSRCPPLLQWNMKQTGAGLLTVFEPLDHLDLDFNALAKNLATTLGDSEQALLNGSTLAIRERSFNSTGIAYYFKRLGLTLSWTEMCKEKSLQLAFGGTGPTKTATDVQTFLDASLKARNRLAHSQAASMQFTRQEIDSNAVKLKALAAVFDSKVQNQINFLCPPRKAKQPARK